MPVLSERIILLPGADGNSSGAVSIKRSGQVVELSRALEQTESYDQGAFTAPTVASSLPVQYRGVVQNLPVAPSHYVLYYASGNANLSKEAQEILAHVLEDVRTRPFPNVQVVGYTDTVGSEEVNLKVSQQRAESVLDFLVKGGVAKDIMTVIGRGKNLLAVPTPDNTPEPKNRRVEISVR